MFDMSWGEIMVIGGVALIVIGPKDLPRALRTVGQMTTKVRRLAGEFQSQFNEAMREAELEDVRKEVEGLNRDVSAATSTAFNPIQTIRDELRTSVESSPKPSEPEWSGNPEWAGNSPLSTPPGVEEVGPSHHVEAAGSDPVRLGAPEHVSADAAAATIPEVAPLVPFPIDEPVVPPPDSTNIVTGPGLEPVAETDRAAKDART